MLTKFEYYRTFGFNWIFFIEDFKKSFQAFKFLLTLIQAVDYLILLDFTETENYEISRSKYVECAESFGISINNLSILKLTERSQEYYEAIMNFVLGNERKIHFFTVIY